MVEYTLAMQPSTTDSTQIWCNYGRLWQIAVAGRGLPHATFWIANHESGSSGPTRDPSLGSPHCPSRLAVRNRRPNINFYAGIHS